MADLAVLLMLISSVLLIALTAHVSDLLEDIRNELEEYKKD